MWTLAEPNKIYIVRKVLMRAITNAIFIELETLLKDMGIYVNFTKTIHQIFSCHMTPASTFEKFYLLPDSVLNFRKSYQIYGKFAQEQKSYKQKTNWGEGGNTSPSAYRIKLN